MLRDRRLFPVLDDLSGRGDQYRTYFQRPLNALAADLLNAGGEVKSDDPFEQAVNEVARKVENACTKLRT